MILRAECTMDLDEKRRVWVEASAELGDDEIGHAPKVVEELIKHVSIGAQQAHGAAVERGHVAGHAGGKPGPQTFTGSQQKEE